MSVFSSSGLRAAACGLVASACLLASGIPASADTLSLPATSVERSGEMTVVYHPDRPASGSLTLDWTDGLGRVVEHRTIAVGEGSAAIGIALDLRKAVTTQNDLRVVSSAGGSASARFIARPPQTGWSDYEIIMWQDWPDEGHRTLLRQGVDAGKVYAKSGVINQEHLASNLAAGSRFYLENIATDFLAPYHMASQTTLFDAAHARYAADPTGTAAFVRTPSLSDPVWLARLGHRMTDMVTAMRIYRPLFYNLGDETGIGDLAAAWDFDMSEPSLSGMRSWLAQRYGSLDALNAEWGSAFARWADVTPMLTNAAVARADHNFAAWGDFKAWMDVAYVRALGAGTAAVHAADPQALAAIEGAQIPGWGGYDYGLLSSAVDLMEIYNFGANIEIARSLNPNLIVLTTSFSVEPAEQHRLWREILLGARGHIIYDDAHTYLNDDNTPGPHALAASALYHELRGGVPAQIIASQPQTDAVAILYSQASFRTHWLLDRIADGKPWTDRKAETEYEDNAWRASMVHAVGGLAHLGLQPRFLSSEMLERGVPEATKLLILPQSIALSASEAEAIQRFLAAGGHVMADGDSGLYDQHSRRQEVGMLAKSEAQISHPAFLAASVPVADMLPGLSRAAGDAGVAPAFRLSHADGSPVTDVVTKVFRNGDLVLLGLQHDDAAQGPHPEPLVLHLDHAAAVTDLRAHRALGTSDTFAVSLDPATPTLLALAPSPLAALDVAGPAQARAGTLATWHLHAADRPHAARRVVQVAVRDPSGAASVPYSRTVILADGAVDVIVPFAVNDPPGTWTLEISDILSGQILSHAVDLVR